MTSNPCSPPTPRVPVTDVSDGVLYAWFTTKTLKEKERVSLTGGEPPLKSLRTCTTIVCWPTVLKILVTVRLLKGIGRRRCRPGRRPANCWHCCRHTGCSG